MGLKKLSRAMLMIIFLWILICMLNISLDASSNLEPFFTINDNSFPSCFTQKTFESAEKDFTSVQLSIMRDNLTREENETLIKADVYSRIAQLKREGIPLKDFMSNCTNQFEESCFYLVQLSSFVLEAINIDQLNNHHAYSKFLNGVLRFMEKKDQIIRVPWSDCGPNEYLRQQYVLLRYTLKKTEDHSNDLAGELNSYIEKNNDLRQQITNLTIDYQKLLERYNALLTQYETICNKQ